MAKSKGNQKKTNPEPASRRNCRPLPGILFFVLAVLIIVALWHFHPDQVAVNTTDPDQNPVGKLGVQIGYHSFQILGGAGWLLAAASLYLSQIYFFRASRISLIKFAALFTCLISGASLLSMQGRFFTEIPPATEQSAEITPPKYPRGPGGIVGSLIYGTRAFPDPNNTPAENTDPAVSGFLHDNLGTFGSAFVLGILFLASCLLLFTGNPGDSFQRFLSAFNEWREERRNEKAVKKEERKKARAEQAAARAEQREKKRAERAAAKTEKNRQPRLSAQEKLERELDANAVTPDLPNAILPPPSPKSRTATRSPAPAPTKPAALPTRTTSPADSKTEPEPALPKPRIIKTETTRKAATKLPERKGDHQFPSLDLLDKPEPVPADNRENHEETAHTLIETLKTFGVEATVDEIHVGPVITRFDILPAPGTKVSKIQGLENDIAMGLKALAVRILAPVPGKGCVGVEIPNRNPQAVTLREIIESEDWVNSRAEIPIGLGKDVSGKPLVADLTKMPHLLIAGSTGSGKTVCINSIIASLLFHASPDEVRFIMIDPKIVEMKVFNDLPHMLIPVVTDPKKVPGALKWLLNEMQRRYEIFAAVGVRNITGFRNYKKKKAEREQAEQEAANADSSQSEIDGNLPEAVAPQLIPDDDIEIPESLPYIVCIIDELADLMMVAPADIESGIARLAQLARAAGIHLILATQRPSVNVITGVIKANLPSRISFKVASRVDSRTILDTGGADTLIGRGDMLFLPPGSSRLIRSQGAFVSDEEITAIVEDLKRNGPPVYAEEIQREIDSEGEDDGFSDDDVDELFESALEVLRTTKRASTSMLQRRLRIGYNRAARIMEDMEDRGIVGPENGSSPRDILVDLETM